MLPSKSITTIVIAALYAIASLYIGYLALGIWSSFIFTFGFLGGFILWLLMPMNASWPDIRIPYFITLTLFIVHKIEEDRMNFFPALAKLTGVPVPSVTSLPAILLLVIAAAWLLIPVLFLRRSALGYFLAWTFFAGMGIIELAHFVFPFFTGRPYGYFPGMWSVILLAPSAWWGMYRLSKHT